jgi:predicted amidohydrolase YtcJ
MLYTQKELHQLATKIKRANLQVIIHAMGDKAIETAIKTFESLTTTQTANRLPHRLEQAALLNKQLIKRIKKSNLIISIQPKVVESEFNMWQATEHLGKQRANMLFPLKTLTKNGIRVMGGSDCPMEPLNPLLGIQSSMTRDSFPKERLNAEEALQLYTFNAAYATLEENKKGSIEVGKLGDIAVLSADPINERINAKDIKVEITIIGGRIVYQKSKQ